MKNNFLVVITNSESEKSVVERADESARRALPYHPSYVSGRTLGRFSGYGCYFFDFELNAADRVQASHGDDESHLSLAGLPISGLYGLSDHYARELSAALSASSLSDVMANLYGSFAISYCNLKAGAFAAIADFGGIEPLFYYYDGKDLLVSTRASMISAYLGNSIGIDIESISEIFVNASLVGERSSFKSVRQLLPGERLTFDFKELKIENVDSFFCDSRDSLDYDLAAQDFIDVWRAYSDFLPENIGLSLTGGKDSRLNLAGAIGAGLSDRVLCFTNGEDDHPEVEAAEMVARAVGVKHSSRIPRNVTNEFSPSGFWRKIFHHPRQYDWSVCPWDGLSLPSRLAENHEFGVEVSGLGAAFYKPVGKNYNNTDFSSIFEREKFFESWLQPSNPLNLLSDAVVNSVLEKISRRCDDLVESGLSPHNLSARLLLEGRQSMWSGLLSRGVFSKFRVYPLLDRRVLRHSFKQTQAERSAFRFHYEVMKRCCPEIVRLPFLKDSWPDALSKYGASDDICKPFVTKKQPKSSVMVADKWLFLRNEASNIIEFIKMGRTHDGAIGAVFNSYDAIDKAVGVVNSKDDVVLAKLILNSIFLKIVSNGFESPMVGGAAFSPLVSSNISDFCFQFDGGEAFFDEGNLVSGGEFKEISFSLSTNVTKLRLDPLKSKGIFFIKDVSLIGPDSLIKISMKDLILKNIDVVYEKVGLSALYSLNSDPQIIFRQKFSSGDLRDARLVVKLLVPKSSRIELFTDIGEGFNEKHKQVEYFDC